MPIPAEGLPSTQTLPQAFIEHARLTMAVAMVTSTEPKTQNLMKASTECPKWVPPSHGISVGPVRVSCTMAIFHDDRAPTQEPRATAKHPVMTPVAKVTINLASVWPVYLLHAGRGSIGAWA